MGVTNSVMRHDLDVRPDPMSEAYPHLVFEGFSTPLGERVVHILKNLFPVPKSDSRRVITFSHKNNLISFRHHTYDKP
jgi:U3 small nucleolar ribonucleoprotein protein IMP4